MTESKHFSALVCLLFYQLFICAFCSHDTTGQTRVKETRLGKQGATNLEMAFDISP